MSVHYKFKSTLDYDTITFDGLHISVADLKKAILQQKRLSKVTDFDLQIINAQTKEEYQHDCSLIPKNTSLIISRVPVANQTRKLWEGSNKLVHARLPLKVESADFDLSKMEGSEEDKIQVMMLQSTAEYDPKSYQKIRGFSQTGEVPSTYRCNKCKRGGHWIKNCPLNISKEHTVEKRTTGIPKSFRDKDGRAFVIEIQESVAEEEKKQEIPDDLICSICNDLFVDAVMIPCCGSSFCDDCVRTALLESEDNECPDCREKGSSPGSLIPNRFLRNSVNAFKNRTGYKVCSQTKEESKQLVEVNLKQNENLKDEEEYVVLQGEKSEEGEVNKDEKNSCKSQSIENDIANPENNPVEESSCVLNSENDNLKQKNNVISSPVHEDSDYEDNIVVKVPSALDTRTEKYLSRRHALHPRPPGIEQNSPKSKQVSSYNQDNNSNRSSEPLSNNAKDWDHLTREKVCSHHDSASNDIYIYDKGRTMASAKSMDNVEPPGANAVPVSLYPPHQPYELQQRPIRPINMHPGFHNHMHRPSLYPHPNISPHHPPHQLRLPMPTVNSYEPAFNAIGNMVPGYQRFPTAVANRFNYPIREAESQSQIRPFNNIASVYEEIAAKVGVGIIDDPLEAFNRIMKEKEKKKDERRSPDRRRRSKERHIRGNFRTSPYSSRTKDHGYHDKRGRSRERDNDRRWNRYGKMTDLERERERDRDRERERDRDRDREKDQNYRSRRSKSLDRSSRSRSHSPPSKRYRSPQITKTFSSHEKHPHYYNQKFSLDEEGFDKHKRDLGKSQGNSSKYFDSRGGSRQNIDNEDKNLKPYNINDENSEPPPPGFEVQTSRNPFHTNKTSPLSTNKNCRQLRNNTPDLYEKCVSQDMEENKLYNIGNKVDHKSGNRSQTRSRSRSCLRLSEKRRKINRSLTPKGKPIEDNSKREKDTKHKSEEEYTKKEKEFIDHVTKQRSMTPPRQKDIVSDQHQTSSETDQKEKPESKKSEKKLKDRKKKRKEKSERKRVKKEKKSKKERHRFKSEEKDNTYKEDEKNDNGSANGVKTEEKSEIELITQEDLEEEGEYRSIEKEIDSKSSPKSEQNGSNPSKYATTPNQETIEYEKKASTSDIKCFDAVLDIHEYETDFDDNGYKIQEGDTKLVPEVSKWEIEDHVNVCAQFEGNITDSNLTQNNTDNKVTNEVIVRAEKAIFARAINAIRPLELRKKSLSKEKSSKCYADEHENIRNIQITLPVTLSKERSIEVKNESNEKKKSIKDRLGSKISHPIYSQIGETHRESDHTYKSSYTNVRDVENDRRNKGGADCRAGSKKTESEKTNRDSQGVREKEKYGDQKKVKEKEVDRDRERNRDRDRDRDKDKGKDHGRDKERVRHREKYIVEKYRDLQKDNVRSRGRDRCHEVYGEQSRLNSKSRDHITLRTDKSHHGSERVHREHENTSRKHNQINSTPVSQRKRSPSPSNSDSDNVDRKRKNFKNEKKSHKRSESPDSKKSNKKKNKSDKKKKKKSKK